MFKKKPLMPRGRGGGGGRGGRGGRGRGGRGGGGGGGAKHRTSAGLRRTSNSHEGDDEIWTASDKHSGLNVYDDSVSSSKTRGSGGRKAYNDDEDDMNEEDVAPVLIGADNDFDEEEDDDDEDEDDDESDDEDNDDEDIPNSSSSLKASSSSSRPSRPAPSNDDIDRQLSAWGRKKSTFYDNDADVDFDDEAAKAEEVEAIRLQRQRAADLDDGDEDIFSFPALIEARKQQKLAEASGLSKQGASSSTSSSRFHTVEVIQKDRKQLTRQEKLKLILTEAPELVGLLEDMTAKTREMKEKIAPALEQAKKRNSSSKSDKNKDAEGDSVLQYLQVRNQLLLTYVIDVTFVMLLKAEGKSIRDHPVIAQLVQIQTILEKMKSLDVKMQPHINRLLTAARLSQAQAKAKSSSKSMEENEDEDDKDDDEEEAEIDYSDVKNHPRAIQAKVGKAAMLRASSSSGLSSLARPNPHALLAHGSDVPVLAASKKKSKMTKNDDEEDDDDGFLDEDDEMAAGDGLYKPLRRSSVEFDGDKSSKTAKAEKDRLRAMKRLSKSALLADIKQAYGDAPEQDDFTGTQSEAFARKAADEALDKIQAERTAYEEDTHTRVGMSKAEKKMRKARAREVERWDSLAELEQFGDLDSLTKKLDDADESGKSRKLGGLLSGRVDMAASRSARGVERSAEAVVGGKRARQGRGAGEHDDDDEDRPLGLSKQRKSYGDDDDGDDDGGMGGQRGRRDEEVEEDPLYAALAQAAAHKKAKKSAQREAEKEATSEFLRERGDEYLDEGTARGPNGKRSVSREIMKNRGLTKYRSKIERNPRVHNRVKAAKFAMRRKGQVVSMRDPSEGDKYGGESTGIRTNVIKSRQIKN